MNSQLNFDNPQKNYLYLCDVDLDSDLELFLQDINKCKDTELTFCFDRSLWAKLSSGCIPPQLYDFAINSGVNFLILSKAALSLESLKSFRSYEVQLTGVVSSGSYEPSEFTEEDFLGGFYVNFLRTTQELTDVPGALKLTASNNHLYLCEEMFAVDTLIQENKEVVEMCQCFFAPSKEQFLALPELLKDKEKIHLSDALTGIRC